MLFKHPPTRPSSPVAYPAGVFVNTEKGYFYIAGPDKRLRCITKRVLDSWSPPRVVLSSEAACENFKIAGRLKFRNGSLLHDLTNGQMYFISEGKRRNLRTPEAYDTVGAVGGARANILRVTSDEINLHEEGLPIT
jgi:hypothetical protein